MSAKLEGEFIFQNGDKNKDASHSEEANPQKPATEESQVAERVSEVAEEAEQNDVHFYTSLCRNPRGVSFEAQDDDENIILLIRRSFATNIPWMALGILLLILPLSFPFLPPLPILDGVTFLSNVLALLFYYLVILGFVLVNFSLWYFHVGLVTNKRIIDVDLYGILSRHVSETRLSLIQDVSYKQVGLFRSLFRFGDVHVQTAGSEQNIEFDRAPRPILIAQYIGELVGKPYHSE